MKSFYQYIRESNSTANMVYTTAVGYDGANFAVDQVPTNFDVETWSDDKDRMRPWEVNNAIAANTRRTHVLKWLKAAGGQSKRAVTEKSIPITPDWQSKIR
jgi:hypothetical protein